MLVVGKVMRCVPFVLPCNYLCIGDNFGTNCM